MLFVRLGNLSTCLKSCDVGVYRLAPLSRPSRLIYFVTTMLLSMFCCQGLPSSVSVFCFILVIPKCKCWDKIHELITTPHGGVDRLYVLVWMVHNSCIASGSSDNGVGKPVLLVNP